MPILTPAIDLPGTISVVLGRKPGRRHGRKGRPSDGNAADNDPPDGGCRPSHSTSICPVPHPPPPRARPLSSYGTAGLEVQSATRPRWPSRTRRLGGSSPRSISVMVLSMDRPLALIQFPADDPDRARRFWSGSARRRAGRARRGRGPRLADTHWGSLLSASTSAGLVQATGSRSPTSRSLTWTRRSDRSGRWAEPLSIPVALGDLSGLRGESVRVGPRLHTPGSAVA